MVERKRNIRGFKQASPEQRRNSQSIRRMLYDTIRFKYKSSVNLASSEFSAALNRVSDKRKYHRGMTVESIYRTSIDYHFFNYSQLDALAQVHNIPLSLLLIFTRVRSEMESVDRRRTNEAQRIVVAFRSAIDHLDGLVTRGSKNGDDIYEILNYEVFKEFIAIYLHKFDETLL